MIYRKLKIPIILLLVFGVLQGCMYSFRGSLPAHIDSIAIPLFENRTAEYQINETITDLLTEQFIQENVFRLEDENTADSILEGAVTRVTDSPNSYNEAEQVIDYRVTIGLDVQWYDVVEDRIRLETSVSGWGVYDANQANSTRADGIEAAIEKITQDIINDITANW